MAPKKNEYSADLQQTLIKHYRNGHSQQQMLRNWLFLELHFILSLISTKKPNALKILSVEAENVRALYIFSEK